MAQESLFHESKDLPIFITAVFPVPNTQPETLEISSKYLHMNTWKNGGHTASGEQGLWGGERRARMSKRKPINRSIIELAWTYNDGVSWMVHKHDYELFTKCITMETVPCWISRSPAYLASSYCTLILLLPRMPWPFQGLCTSCSSFPQAFPLVRQKAGSLSFFKFQINATFSEWNPYLI